MWWDLILELQSSDGQAYVTNWRKCFCDRYRANTVTATVPVGNWPEGIAVTPDGKKAYVANSGNITAPEDTVSVINIINDTVIDTRPAGRHPCGVAVTPDGKKVYVANTYGGTVSVVDAATDKLLHGHKFSLRGAVNQQNNGICG